MTAFLIDAFEFCRLKESRDGEIAVADLPRLVKEAVANTGTLRWALQGGANQFGHPQLQLSVQGSVRLMCQRCLTPFEFPIDSSTVLVLADDEAAADHIEAVIADDDVDVIVGSRQCNIRDLIEDEALLAIPVAPKHDVCPDQAERDLQVGSAKAPSPFDALKNWKQ